MTCAQGLLRLLWGGPEVGVLRDWFEVVSKHSKVQSSWLIVFSSDAEFEQASLL